MKKTTPFIKRSNEQEVSFNIKHDSKSCYAYARSKRKVQDKTDERIYMPGGGYILFLFCVNLL